MAIIEQGILGPFRGKCGGVIGYVRNGVFCMRSVPAHYRDRKSAAQLRNRNRMTMVMRGLSVVRRAVALGFGRFATGMTELNVATRVNYYRLVQDGAAGMEYRWGDLVLSRGQVEGLSGLLYSVSGGCLRLNWNNLGLDARGAMDDGVTVVAVNSERMEMRMWRGVARRGEGVAEVTLPGGWSGEEVWCYTMVSRGTEWSESTCVGMVCGGGGVVLALAAGDDAGIDDVVDGRWGGMGDGVVCFGTDQSAIKVLPELGQSCAGEGLDEVLRDDEVGPWRRE